MKHIRKVLFLTLVPAALFAGTTTAVTPEPASIAMLASGVAGIGFIAWRRRKR